MAPGQRLIIPRRPWNLSGVYASGYQLVPVLTYHDIGPQAKGRLVIAAKSFADQDGPFQAELVEEAQYVHGLDLVGLPRSWRDAEHAILGRKGRGETQDNVIAC